MRLAAKSVTMRWKGVSSGTPTAATEAEDGTEDTERFVSGPGFGGSTLISVLSVLLLISVTAVGVS
jgi:hypothetical protein